MNYDYGYGYEANLVDHDYANGYEHANCLGHPPQELLEVAVKPARNSKDMRPARQIKRVSEDGTARVSSSESQSNKVNSANLVQVPHSNGTARVSRSKPHQNKVNFASAIQDHASDDDDDFDSAIQDHVNVVEKEIVNDKGDKFELVVNRKGPKFNRHASSSTWYGKVRPQFCCINSIEREIAETKPMKESDRSGKSWEKIRVKLDSGAIDWVFTPEAGEAFDTKPSIFSKYGINYTAANGTEIKNFGQKTLTGYSNEWKPLSVNVQIADVKSNLAAGMKIVEAENRIVLDSSGSYIENKVSGDRIQIRHENGFFVFDMWVPAKKETRKGANGARDARKGPSSHARKSINNSFAPIAEDDEMEVGEIEEEEMEAVFVRQEC